MSCIGLCVAIIVLSHHVDNYFMIVVFCLLGDSSASEFYVPTFWNTLFHLHRWCKPSEHGESLKSRILHDCYSLRLCIYIVIYCNVELDKSKVTFVTIRNYNKWNEMRWCAKGQHSADERVKKLIQITGAQRSGREHDHVAYVCLSRWSQI